MNLTGLTFDDVLLTPQEGVLESRKDADVSVPSLNLDIPLIAAPMPSVASTQLLTKMAELGGMGVVHRMNRTEQEIIYDYDWCHVMPPVAVGLDTDLDELHKAGISYYVLDIAHAHSHPALRWVKSFKKKYPDSFLLAGNVATSEGAYDLAEQGADAIKVGIGPGSVCTTRQVTGFGVPQLQAIQECYIGSGGPDDEDKVPIIADGGIRNSGDIVKALAAGADAVMIGNLFAHSVEADNGGIHYGCASKEVNGHHAPEGISVELFELDQLTGAVGYAYTPEPLEDIVKRLVWGIKSGISYGGATDIQGLRDNAEWIRLSDAGRKESKL